MKQLRRTFSTEVFQHALNKQVRQCWSKTKVHQLSVNGTDQPCGLYACLRHALRLARWMGFFPVEGLGQTRADETRFKIKCYYSCYYFATLLGQAVVSFFATWYFFQNDIRLSNASKALFYVSSLLSAILLLKLSHQWPQLVAKATEIEQSLTELKLENNKTILQTTVVAYVVMALALVEYILYKIFNINIVINYCLPVAGITTDDLEHYVTRAMPHVFNHVPYSTFNAFVFQFVYLQTTFLWSFNDMMITCFSIYITEYFRNLNKIIVTNAKKKKFGLPWSVLRVHYSNLVKLVKEIDVQISFFILVALFNNLYYICVQLFNLHYSRRSHVNSKFCNDAVRRQVDSSSYYVMYYLYSSIFLVLRATMLLLYAANLHCVALEPVYSLCEVPSSVYDIEVHRFQLQLRHTVALSGGFFYVTRNTIVKMVSTIVTFEILLLQFAIQLTPDPYFNNATVATTVENVTALY